MKNQTTNSKRMRKANAIAVTLALAICFTFPANAYSVGASYLIDVAAKRANSGNLSNGTTPLNWVPFITALFAVGR